MGRVFDPKCRSCGHEWRGEVVGGSMRAVSYRCDRCGAVGHVTNEDLVRAGLFEGRSVWGLTRLQAEKVLGTCSCGGAFDIDAPARCPRCHSDDVDLGGPRAMVD